MRGPGFPRVLAASGLAGMLVAWMVQSPPVRDALGASGLAALGVGLLAWLGSHWRRSRGHAALPLVAVSVVAVAAAFARAIRSTSSPGEGGFLFAIALAALVVPTAGLALVAVSFPSRRIVWAALATCAVVGGAVAAASGWPWGIHASGGGIAALAALLVWPERSPGGAQQPLSSQ